MSLINNFRKWNNKSDLISKSEKKEKKLRNYNNSKEI